MSPGLIAIFRDIGIIVGAIASIIALLRIFWKPISKMFSKSMKEFIKNTNSNDYNSLVQSLNEHLETSNKNYELTNKNSNEIKEHLCSFEEKLTQTQESVADLSEVLELNNNGTKCILADKIMYSYDKYKDNDSIPVFLKDELVEFHDIYSKLGGNGKISFRYEELMKKQAK